MKAIGHKLVGATFTAAAVLATGQEQSASKELRVDDMMAQQPRKAIVASAPCRRAWESPEHHITQSRATDPQTLFHDLGSLMENSEEVVLAGRTYSHSWVLSPSSESVATYFDVKVIRTWKGSHNVGDVLTFGIPMGTVHCGETESHHSVSFSTMDGTSDLKGYGYVGPYVLFLRKAQGKEAQLVQGLFPAGGEGLQGMYPIQLPPTSEESRRCNGVLPGHLEWCDSFLDTSQSPIIVPYVHDPLAKQYEGMSMSEFLHEVRAVATEQGLYEKSTTVK